MILGNNGEVYRTAVIPKSGDYILRVNAFGHQAGKESVRMEIRIDNRPIKTVIVTATKDQPQIYEFPVKLAEGERRLAMAFMNSYFNPSDPDQDNRVRNLVVRYIEIAGLMEANEHAGIVSADFCETTDAADNERRGTGHHREFCDEGISASGDERRT